jgi:hypothetical protein
MSFIASVLLLISSSSQHARSQIQPLSGVTADQIVAVAGQIVFAADLGRRVAGCSVTMWRGRAKRDREFWARDLRYAMGLGLC